MKYVKMLGLLAVAAAALMAFAGTASATEITSSAGSTPNIVATAGPTSLDGAFTTVTCTSSEVEGNVESHGSGTAASGEVDTLHFNGCNYPTTVVKNGSLSITGTSPTGDGTLLSSGAEVVIHTSVGTCNFTTSFTGIGTVTGSNNSGSFLCGSSGTWTGSYTINSPASFEVH
jgi:hypothetical protein